MVICNCNLDQLMKLEMILFAAEWNSNPYIPPFQIQCDNEIYNYKVIKNFDKYHVVTI